MKNLLTSLFLFLALAAPAAAQQQVTVADGAGRAGQARTGDADTDAGTYTVLWTLPCLTSTSGCVAGGTTTNPFTVNSRTQDGTGNAITSATRGSERALTVQVVDASGNQVTSFGGGSGGTALADDADFTAATTQFTPTGGFYQSTVTACTDGDTCAAGITSQRAWKVTLFDTSGAAITGGTDYTHDAALTPASTAGPVQTFRASAAAPTDVSADNDAVIAWALRSGAQVIQPSFGGVLQATGNGVAGTNTPRVTIASDNSSVPVTCSNCTGSGASKVDDAAFTIATDSVAPLGALFDNVTPDSVDEGDAGLVRMSANRNLFTTIRDAAGNERGANVDASGNLQVAGAVTVSSIVPGVGATNLAKLEDAVAATGDVGVMILGQIQATPAASAADGDYGTAKLTADGKVWGAGAYREDDAHTTLDPLVAMGCVRRDTTPSSSSGTAADYSNCNIDANGRVYVNATLYSEAGAALTPATDVTEDAAETPGGTGPQVMSVRRDVLASSAGTSGDNATFNTTSNGALWVAQPDPCSFGTKVFVNISQTASAQLFTGTASNRTYVCSIHLVTATAQNIALVSGTGSVCATGIAGMAGGTTAATGWNLAANGGLVIAGGNGAVAKSAANADNVCLLQSSTGQISGNIVYVVAP